jgi:DNA repair protein RadC
MSTSSSGGSGAGGSVADGSVQSGTSGTGALARPRMLTRPSGRKDAAGTTEAMSRVAVSCDRCRRVVPLPALDGPRLGDPDSVAELVVPLIGTADREHCLAVLLDTKHRVLSTVTVSIGSLDHTFMSPREIMRDALLANAAACVLVHNHPSGDPEPSRDDERVTRRLVEAGRLVGVEVLDHLVVGGGTWVSLARRGFV